MKFRASIAHTPCGNTYWPSSNDYMECCL